VSCAQAAIAASEVVAAMLEFDADEPAQSGAANATAGATAADGTRSSAPLADDDDDNDDEEPATAATAAAGAATSAPTAPASSRPDSPYGNAAYTMTSTSATSLYASEHMKRIQQEKAQRSGSPTRYVCCVRNAC
jgi:hypothetical protein